MPMDAKTIDDARKNLDQLMDQAADNAEPIIITRTGKSAAVLVSLDEWNNLQATLELVRSPANRDRLNRAMRDADAGKAVVRELVAK
jgi:antitoxin YefM